MIVRYLLIVKSDSSRDDLARTLTPNKLQIFTVHSLAEFAATPDNVNALVVSHARKMR